MAVNVHATCVMLGDAGRFMNAPRDAGVLLLGESGAGKSDLALRLIERGAKLVSDDRTDLFSRDGRLAAQAPPPLVGLLEVRGVGILKMPYVPWVHVALAVFLQQQPGERLPDPERYQPPPGLNLPMELAPPQIRIDPQQMSAAARIVAAAAGFTQRCFLQEGYAA